MIDTESGRFSFAFALLGLFGILCVEVNAAANIGVAPVIVRLAPNSLATSIEITNNGASTVAFESSLYRWRMTDGESQYESASQLFVSPPVFEIPPGGRQTVRIGRLNLVAPPDAEVSYRVEFLEIPRQTQNERAGLNTLLKVSMPVFETPVDPDRPSKPQLSYARVANSDGNLQLKVSNLANVHTVVDKLELFSGDAVSVTVPVNKYILASSSIVITVPAEMVRKVKAAERVRATISKRFEHRGVIANAKAN